MPLGLHHHISNDGIHLTDHGEQLLFNSVFTNKKPFEFSIDDFPPLVRTLPPIVINKSPSQAIDSRIAFKENIVEIERKIEAPIKTNRHKKKKDGIFSLNRLQC